jgi:cell division protein FtsB
MKFLAALFVVLIAALQSPLWFGKGGWLRVWEISRDVQAQRQANDKLRERNVALGAEVRDLKQGYEAIEERARYSLNMIKPDETFVQVIDPPARLASGGSASAVHGTPGAAEAQPGK